MDRIDPDLAIITEGERWPEHMRQASERKVPVLCINARLSDRSYQRMSVWPAASRFLFQGITRLLAGSELDAERFVALGFPKGRITVTGNIKLDVDIPILDVAVLEKLRGELGLPRGRLVLLGSSTWPSEEEALLETLRASRAKGVPCSLLLVPRHAERRGEVEKVVKASGFTYHLRSQGPARAEVDVAIADTTGELRSLTQLADLVFVGKSLLPHTEGQTPVEAATLAKPILFGPGMANFRAIEADLLARGAARTVQSPADLASKASALMANKAERDTLSAAGGAWRRDNGGGVERTLFAIRAELAK